MKKALVLTIASLFILPLSLQGHPHKAKGIAEDLGQRFGDAMAGSEMGGVGNMGGVTDDLGLGGFGLDGMQSTFDGVGKDLDVIDGQIDGLETDMGNITDQVDSLEGTIDSFPTDRLGKIGDLGEVRALEGLESLDAELTEDMNEWGVDSAGFRAFEQEVNSFKEIAETAKKSLDLDISGAKKAVLGFLNMGNEPFEQFRNIKDGYKNMAETYSELKKATNAFAGMDIKAAVTSRVMKEALPSSIEDSIDRSVTMVREFRRAQERIDDLPDRLEREREELKIAAVKFFLKPNSTESNRQCRSMGEVRSDLDTTLGDAGDVLGELDINVGAELESKLMDSDFLDKARRLCEGQKVMGITLTPQEAIQSATETAEDFETFRKTVAEAMYEQYGAVGSKAPTANEAEVRQYQRNSEVALAQQVRERFFSKENGAMSSYAFKRSLSASRRGIRQNMQGMVYAQMMRMQQAGLELMLLNGRLRQIAREANAQ